MRKTKLLCWAGTVWLFLWKTALGASEVSSDQRELNQTPTWAVAAVCAVIIFISVLLEKFLHKLGHWFIKRNKKALYEALQKVQAELMILGFISLLLVFSQDYISKICLPAHVVDNMLPCKAKPSPTEGRKLFESHGRMLAAATPTKCKKGYEPLISVNGLHQLHLFIFFLAVVHVIYSFSTMTIGKSKIRHWKEWEMAAESYDAHDPTKVRLSHEASFVRAHSTFQIRYQTLFYIGCFFRQFFRSVKKTDYLTLRHSFITTHLAPGSKFNFQKYIKRSLEHDFKTVVSISELLWVSFVVFVLLNTYGTYALLVASILTAIVILAIGTQLMAILIRMALEITDKHAVVLGIPLVQSSDKYFWFNWPELNLYLIQFALFQNAFQITHVFWLWYSFGLNSCFHQSLGLVIARVSLGIGGLYICSYITLPLYALVSQMGSSLKKSVFDEQVAAALKRWSHGAKKRVEKGHKNDGSSTSRPLQRHKNTIIRTTPYDIDLEAETEALSPSLTAAEQREIDGAGELRYGLEMAARS